MRWISRFWKLTSLVATNSVEQMSNPEDQASNHQPLLLKSNIPKFRVLVLLGKYIEVLYYIELKKKGQNFSQWYSWFRLSSCYLLSNFWKIHWCFTALSFRCFSLWGSLYISIEHFCPPINSNEVLMVWDHKSCYKICPSCTPVEENLFLFFILFYFFYNF